LWFCINQFSRMKGCSIVLTTHWMEEAETLCNKICIVVNGQLACLGSPHHLRNKYGSGYTISVKYPDNKPHLVKTVVLPALRRAFPSAEASDLHEGAAGFSETSIRISQAEVVLSTMFEILTELYDAQAIEEFVVHQSSLEEVFLQFAKLQVSSEDKKDDDDDDEGGVTVPQGGNVDDPDDPETGLKHEVHDVHSGDERQLTLFGRSGSIFGASKSFRSSRFKKSMSLRRNSSGRINSVSASHGDLEKPPSNSVSPPNAPEVNRNEHKLGAGLSPIDEDGGSSGDGDSSCVNDVSVVPSSPPAIV